MLSEFVAQDMRCLHFFVNQLAPSDLHLVSGTWLYVDLQGGFLARLVDLSTAHVECNGSSLMHKNTTMGMLIIVESAHTAPDAQVTL